MSAHKRESLSWIARKRRRRGSRSVSGRSSDRRGTRRRCCSIGALAAYATYSDFLVAAGTDSSGELIVNSGDANWASDVSKAAMNVVRKEREGGGSGERKILSGGYGQIGNFDGQGNESGYGSESGASFFATIQWWSKWKCWKSGPYYCKFCPQKSEIGSIEHN